MDSLVDKKLYYKDLLLVDSKVLVDRYNECLINLGIEPTKLESFYIDSIGWSPEIADEKQNLFYLGAGLPNPMAIILTPNQLKKPAYMPFNSYDKQAIDLFYKNFAQEIVDITTTHAIGIDIDDSLLDYTSPHDLLLINYIVIKTVLPELSEIASTQQGLVNKYLEKPFGWMNADVRAQIVESAQKYGDLRFRRVNIPQLQINNPAYFYSRAFDGVFVLTSLKTDRKFLILENTTPELSKYIDEKIIYSLNNPEILDVLLQAGLINFSQQYWKSNLADLEETIHMLKMQVISSSMPDLDLGNISEPRLKSLLMEVHLNDGILALERVCKEIEHNKIVYFDSLPDIIKHTLYTPCTC